MNTHFLSKTVEGFSGTQASANITFFNSLKTFETSKLIALHCNTANYGWKIKYCVIHKYEAQLHREHVKYHLLSKFNPKENFQSCPSFNNLCESIIGS